MFSLASCKPPTTDEEIAAVVKANTEAAASLIDLPRDLFIETRKHLVPRDGLKERSLTVQ